MAQLAPLAPLPVSEGAAFPDPVVAANAYCSGRLSEVVSRAVAPFWKECRKRDPLGEAYVWVMRYARCGEHLKIRVHGPDALAVPARQLLAASLDAYFARLGPPGVEDVQKSRSLATPIDAEDKASENYPDRTFLFTSYQRSHVSLGYQPYLADDAFVALLTRCLARGTEVLLERLATDAAGQSSHESQQRIVLTALVAGLSALPFAPSERTLYLLYHRDCLLRAALKQGGSAGGPQKMEETLARFHGQVAALGRGTAALAALAQEQWRGGPVAGRDPGLEAWRCALADLADYVAPLCAEAAYDVDPFADLAVFPPLFKALHGFANQVGLNPLNEAFAHHLLAAVTAADEVRDRPVRLRPPILDGASS